LTFQQSEHEPDPLNSSAK